MKDLRKLIFARDKNKCVYRGTKQNLTLGHYISKYNNGHACEDNLQAECRSCNMKNGKENRKGGTVTGCWGCKKPTMRTYYLRKSKDNKLAGFRFECYNCNDYIVDEKTLNDIIANKNNHFASCLTIGPNTGIISELVQ